MRVIIVDDETAPLELAEIAVRDCLPDAEIACFADPEDALAYARANPPDIAFLDIRMRGMSGLEVMRHLKGINPCVNGIFVTGYSEYAFDAIELHASGYIKKPVTARKVKAQLDNLLYEPGPPKTGFYAQAFGSFDFFADGRPVPFAREKSRELLALLVDWQGASLTTEQAATYLFEDRNYDRSVKNMMMPIIRALQEGLEAVGAGEVLVRTWGHLAVDTTKFRCDAYDFEKGDPVAVNRFRGEYMNQYSWAEERVGLFMW